VHSIHSSKVQHESQTELTRGATSDCRWYGGLKTAESGTNEILKARQRVLQRKSFLTNASMSHDVHMI